MDHFSISQLARFSGVKAHTIRIWEQRYDALKPGRSEGNTRYYDGSQLRRLLNIVTLIGEGYKVSELCGMSDAEHGKLLTTLRKEGEGDKLTEYYVSQLVAATMEYDEASISRIFSHCLLRMGLRDTYLKVIYPLLVRVGLLWAENAIPPGQEHFISNLIRQKLFTAIDGLPTPHRNTSGWLLFLPEDEFHEIGLLVASFLLRHAGHRVVYLGANVPLASVEQAAKSTGISHLMLFLVHKDDPGNYQNYIKTLGKSFPGKQIYIASMGGEINSASPRKNIRHLNSVADLEEVL